ncbi:xanthine dehydrogenase small subunit [Gynuella sunshinyii]|uniref:Xanthine dehydrogenase, iron-sulfur cluster and FAD-binding subunit A n=1 Tax=Gynuella sunshinyii YC6258 TaxID=1445510 RepID=A0A0C5VPF1_9GAMM|nr:xanthine dehydrogenase small subunit [Gynuella sunshinyii]AJQ92139.1 xanthine dehydrogenase, iron-sulfur cluster and FAD-binding subunit A [Gynuella sunshinyii YC6258]
MLSFTLNNEPVEVDGIKPDTTILELLRTKLGRSGTKEGCGSGDCGACTVVLASETGFRTINSCISLASQLQGQHLITVEGLQSADGSLHPVQQAMVEHHGSQCGFCTPGFVMSLFALYQQRLEEHSQPITRAEVAQALAGNLCRCTGYEPIIQAAMQACNAPEKDPQAQVFEAPAPNRSRAQVDGYWQPESRDQLRTICQAHPEARFVAGATDLGVEITQRLQPVPALIDLTAVKELGQWHQDAHALTVGAAVRLSQLHTLMLVEWPELAELFERLGSTPIRHQGTLGGNLGTASPIGDCAPWLMALGASVVVSDGDRSFSYLVNDFFTGYRQTRLEAGQWIDHVVIPRRRPDQWFRTYKISKRFDDDISTVCISWLIELDDGKVATARCGLGGVAATPVLVDLSPQLAGCIWQQRDTLEQIQQTWPANVAPMSDVRASADYRLALLPALTERFWLETTTAVVTRVLNHA